MEAEGRGMGRGGNGEARAEGLRGSLGALANSEVMYASSSPALDSGETTAAEPEGQRQKVSKSAGEAAGEAAAMADEREALLGVPTMSALGSPRRAKTRVGGSVPRRAAMRAGGSSPVLRAMCRPTRPSA